MMTMLGLSPTAAAWLGAVIRGRIRNAAASLRNAVVIMALSSVCAGLWCSSVVLVAIVQHRTIGVAVLDATQPECLILSTMVNKAPQQEPIMRLSILLPLLLVTLTKLGFAQASGNTWFSTCAKAGPSSSMP